MSNPLNEQIASLITEIMQLETDRAKIQQFLDAAGLFPGIRMGLDDKSIAALKPKIEQVQILTSRIDSQRQKLVSLELLMLDNSIKDLHSATGQVDGSVKTLDTTTNKVLMSSTKLENLTKLLVLVTVLLAIIAIYQVALLLSMTNPLYGAIGTFAVFVALVYFIWRVFQWKRAGQLTKLTE